MNRLLAGFYLLLGSSALAQALPPEGAVDFVNQSSYTITVTVDGTVRCTISAGSRCTVVLTGDSESLRTVSAESSDRSLYWEDQLAIWECEFNDAGTKTYTFRNDGVPFSCEF